MINLEASEFAAEIGALEDLIGGKTKLINNSNGAKVPNWDSFWSKKIKDSSGAGRHTNFSVSIGGRSMMAVIRISSVMLDNITPGDGLEKEVAIFHNGSEYILYKSKSKPKLEA